MRWEDIDMKKLITQMWNERRTNIGLWIELLVVSVVLWFVVDYLYITLHTYNQPMGFDISNTYEIWVGGIPPSSPNYTELPEPIEARECIPRFILYLQNHPDIEAVGTTDNRGIHYSAGSERGLLRYDTLPAHEVFIYTVTPGYLEVFRMEGMKGETPQEISSRLTGRTFLAGGNLWGATEPEELYNLVNKPFAINPGWADSTSLELGGVLKPFRSDAFASAASQPGIIVLHPEGYIRPNLYIRVKENNTRNFMSHTRHDLEKFLRGQNMMITNFMPISLLRENKLRDHMNELRNHFVVAGFLMLNVFLGLLGTFWFRTQQRTGEIALHIVVGSTRRQVFYRLCAEGMCLLVCATLPALCMDYWITSKELTPKLGELTYTLSRFVVTTGITFVLIAGMIVAGISIPAYRVMKMRPAEALHNE